MEEKIIHCGVLIAGVSGGFTLVAKMVLGDLFGLAEWVAERHREFRRKLREKPDPGSDGD